MIETPNSWSVWLVKIAVNVQFNPLVKFICDKIFDHRTGRRDFYLKFLTISRNSNDKIAVFTLLRETVE